eukprot:comp18479_c0_seq1/m.33126 comp18479_c0_seq1/g.33126  ORF comp18479_c0_seq1/g.33126 comp18479_c0_seq1/m.33126 type:complete len:212 (-) comp18479_c0_seq1:83-718(-)
MGCCGIRDAEVKNAPTEQTKAAPAPEKDPLAEKKAKLSAEQQETMKKYSNLNQEEVLYLIELFNKYDADKSKSIDAKELRPLMKEFGVELSKKATLQLLQKTKGKEKNPQVSLDDFLKMMTPYVRKRLGALMETTVELNPFELLVMKREFSRADADGSGFIDEKELAAIIKVTPAEAKEYIGKYHKGDGSQLNFDEFVQIKVARKQATGAK